MIALPKDILERVDRILDYHRVSKHTPASVGRLKPQTDPAAQPSPVRVFPGLPKVALPTHILDIPVPAVEVVREGLPALPPSHVRPPQDLKTIATWLYMAYGVAIERSVQGLRFYLRTCPSAGALYPCEIYLAAFAVEGLKPGLYSFNPHEFTLTQLRDGPETLSHIKRGRPDLAFMKSVPAAVLVSTIFWRSAWKYRVRGLRVAMLDAGHLVANLVAVANGLGIQTMTRLKMNDTTIRELTGLWYEHDFNAFEAVQAMVVWADDASSPLERPGPPGPPPAFEPIERVPLSKESVPYGSIVAAHFDCAAPGVAIRDIKPPFTELSPMPIVHQSRQMPDFHKTFGGPTLRQVLLKRRSSRDFQRRAVPHDAFMAVNRSAFRTGTFPPVLPEGPYLGLIRAFWVIHAVTAVPAGVWYYHPHTDRWVMLAEGDYREMSQAICLGQARCGNAAALCIMVANLDTVMHGAGPDAYRLAHLEAGIAGQRLALAAAASGLGSCGICSFYDDEARAFLGLEQSNWEVLYAAAIGVPEAGSGPPGIPGLGVG
jgi:SagB-type dehydrogenase family enzyme